tara:strand:- start:307 stop:615 length:309 start_codon:yes stop_codon:yes gene_type:complete
MQLKKILLLNKKITGLYETASKIKLIKLDIENLKKENKEKDNRIKVLENAILKVQNENKVILSDFYTITSYINNIHSLIEQSILHDNFDFDILKKEKKEEYH